MLDKIRKALSGVLDIWPLLLFLLLLFIALLPQNARAADAEDSVVVDKESIMRMQQAIIQHQQVASSAQGEMLHWFDKFRALKDCVRASKSHAESLACIGDTQS